MKVTDIILKENHDLKEDVSGVGELGAALAKVGGFLARKAGRMIFGFSKAESLFINNWANKYAYETAQQMATYGKKAKVDTFEQWWAKQLANDPKLAASEMAKDKRLVEELSAQATKRAEVAYKEIEAASTGAKAKPVKNIKPGGLGGGAGRLVLAPFKWTAQVIRKHWLSSLGLAAGLLEAAYGYFVTFVNNEEEIRQYIEAGMTPTDKAAGKKSTDEDLLAWAEKAHAQNNTIWHTQLAAIIGSLLVGGVGIKLLGWLFGKVASVGAAAAGTVGGGTAAVSTASGIGKVLMGLSAVEQLYVLQQINNEADIGTIGNYIAASLEENAKLPVMGYVIATGDVMLKGQAEAAQDVLQLADKILALIKPNQTGAEDELRRKVAAKQSQAAPTPTAGSDTAATTDANATAPATTPSEEPKTPEGKPVNPYSSSETEKPKGVGYKTSSGWEIIGISPNGVTWGNEKLNKHVQLPAGQEP